MIKDIKILEKKFRKRLLSKKMSAKNLTAFLNVFKLFSSLRVFNVNKHPFDGFKYISDFYLKNVIYSLYFLYFLDFFKGVSAFLKNAIKIKVLITKHYNINYIFKEWKKKS